MTSIGGGPYSNADTASPCASRVDGYGVLTKHVPVFAMSWRDRNPRVLLEVGISLSIPNPPAFPTESVAVGINAGVQIIEGMPAMAMGFAAVNRGHPCSPSQPVLMKRFGFKMLHFITGTVDAEMFAASAECDSLVMAKVIQSQSRSDISFHRRPDISMDQPIFTSHHESAIAANLGSRPDKTTFYGPGSQSQDFIEGQSTGHKLFKQKEPAECSGSGQLG